MLKKLFVQNYAIIDEIEIDFSGRLNIITGETGAGKSILMGALSLILGDRADSSVLLDRSKKSVAEGPFDTNGQKAIKAFLKENDLDTGRRAGDPPRDRGQWKVAGVRERYAGKPGAVAPVKFAAG